MFQLLAVLGVMLVCAQVPAPAAGQKVKVTLVVILASEVGNTIDGKLTEIAAEIRIKNPSLKSFHLKSMATETLAVDARSILPLVDDKTVTITVHKGADKDKKASLAVIAPDQGEIVYECACEKFLPIVTRYQTRNKERLILAIRVQPCKE